MIGRAARGTIGSVRVKTRVTSAAWGGLVRGVRELHDGDEYRHRVVPSNYPALRDVARDVDAKSIRLQLLISKFATTDFAQHPNKRYPQTFTVQGKIHSIRKSGKAMYFIDIVQDMTKLQVMANNSLMGITKPEFSEFHDMLKKGDYISCVGFPSTTNLGELTVKLTRPITLLTPCLNSMMLDKMVDKKIINSNRIMNYLTNPEAKERILIKSLIIKSIRDFLSTAGFLEVLTPLLNGESTGANAKPFVTRANAIDSPLQLRVAPELWLKKLVISGFERIFEIGSSFRNEGIDATHNPEFTTCEFYQSFTDLDMLMEMTEQLFSHIHQTLKGQNLILLLSTLPELEHLTLKFDRYEFIPTLESKTGIELPPHLDSESLIQYHNQLNIPVPTVKSPASLLDNLSSIYLESLSEGTKKPIFIYNQPAALSPLSKSTLISYNNRQYDISLRFELFIDGKEYVNAYEEENSPVEQLAKFKLQQSSKEDYNDQESLIPDWNYIKLLEYGLPPTGGWGCGIDRLAMLFSGSDRIDEVLPFGNVRDVLKN